MLFITREWLGWLAGAAALLDAADLARVQRRRNPHERDELTLCYAIHRLVIGTHLGIEPVTVPLVRDALGCPRVPGTGVSTSLSHAGGGFAVALSTAGPVGVDIEPADRAGVMPEIAERVAHPDEMAALGRESTPAVDRSLLALWVRKEALLKAAGTGMAREMHTFCAPENEVLVLAPPGPALARLQALDLGGGWIGAVAAPPGILVEYARLRPFWPLRQR
ncbi:4'-phosphopantetheinyl transferase family protein [Luteimonas sp. A277]